MEFPQTLIDRLKSGKVIPFIGAGVSMSVLNATTGETLFPSWKKLLELAADRIDAEMINGYGQIVRGQLDIAKPNYLEAAKNAREGLGPLWYEFLREQIDLRSNQADARSLDLARSIWKLNSQFIITTNYDNVLRWSCPDMANLQQLNVQAPVEHVQALRDSLTKPTVWHLHGHIDNARKIILSPDGYSRLYPEQGKVEPLYQAALATLRSFLTTHSFLFIGFSLDDESFRKQLSHIDDIFSGASGPHYVLVHEANKAKDLQLGPLVQPIFYVDYGQPLLDLVSDLGDIAKAPEPVPPDAPVYDMRNPVFFVPYRSKGDQVVGQDTALRDVRNQLTLGRRTSVGQTAAFRGLGGLGKTQLAVEYAYAYKDEYPNGVIWLNMNQDIDSQLTELIDQSRWLAPASESKDKIEVARRRLKTFADCLIIFDNVEDVKDIQPYLPEPQVEPHILATSRHELPGFIPVPLYPLDKEHSLKLLVQEAGLLPSNDGEWEATREIARLLDGLPLAIEIAGAYVRYRDVEWTQYLMLLKGSPKLALPGLYLQGSFTKHEADLYLTLRIDEELFATTPALRDILDLLTWSGPPPMGFDLMSSILHSHTPAELTSALDLGVSLRILQRSKGSDGHSIHRLVAEVRREATSLSDRNDWVQEICQSLGNWFEEQREEYSRLLQFEMEADHLRAWRINASHVSPDCECTLAWLLAYLPYHRGDYKESKRCLDEAFGVYHRIHKDNPKLKANLQDDLGSVTAGLGDYLTSVRCYEEALIIRKGLLGEEHLDTATSLGNLGNAQGSLGNYQLQLEFNEKALAIRRKLFGEEHPHIALSFESIGNAQGGLGNYQLQLEFYEKALAIRRKLFGEEYPNIAISFNNIGSAYGGLGNYQLQLKFHEKALAIQQKLFGEEHPDIAKSLSNIGNAHGRLGNYQLQLEFNNKALAICRRLFGEEHPGTATSLGSIGNAHGSLGNYQLQLEFYGKALATDQRLFGEEHPDTATSLSNIGNAQGDLGNYQLQLEFYGKALAIWRKLFGEEHPYFATSLNNIGNAHGNLGNYQLQLEFYGKALEIWRKLFGEEHPYFATSLSNIGNAHGNLGNYQLQLQYLEEARAILQKLFREEHPHITTLLGNIGNAQGDLGNYQLQLEFNEKALAIWQKLFGEEHPYIATSLGNIGNAQGSLGNYQLQFEFYERALAIRRKLFGEEHPDIAISLFSIGNALSRVGRYQDALQSLTKSLSIQDRIIGPKHPRTINTIILVSQVLCKMGRYTGASQVLDEYIRKIPDGDPALRRLTEAKSNVRQALPGSHRRAKSKQKPKGGTKKPH